MYTDAAYHVDIYILCYIVMLTVSYKFTTLKLTQKDFSPKRWKGYADRGNFSHMHNIANDICYFSQITI